jgi:hypothetical protein
MLHMAPEASILAGCLSVGLSMSWLAHAQLSAASITQFEVAVNLISYSTVSMNFGAQDGIRNPTVVRRTTDSAYICIRNLGQPGKSKHGAPAPTNGSRHECCIHPCPLLDPGSLAHVDPPSSELIEPESASIKVYCLCRQRHLSLTLDKRHRCRSHALAS